MTAVTSSDFEVRLHAEPRRERVPEGRAAGRVRLSLTRRAPELIRMHAVRDSIRVAILLAADAITLVLFWGALHGRWVDGLHRVTSGLIAVRDLIPAGQFVVAVVLALILFGCYDAGDRRRDPGAIVGAAGLGTGVALWSQLWHQLGPTLPTLIELWVLAAVTLIVERKVVDWLIQLVRPRESQIIRSVVVGSTQQAARLIDHPVLGETPLCHLAAFFDPRQHPEDGGDLLAKLIRERRIDTLILAGHLNRRDFTAVLDVAAASGCQVLSMPRVPPSSTHAAKVLWHNGYPVVELSQPGIMGAKLVIKRIMDIALSGLALLLLAPLLGLIGLAVRLSSSGPAFFRQTRIGQGGRTFTILKFRTMVADAEQKRAALRKQSLYEDGRLFKVVNDPRVTPLGSFLRRTSLDELPQLWNVLTGDMSLVGPRPPMPDEVELYQGHHYARFDVKPGITGPWQVSGRNSIRNFEKVIRLETAYIRRWSIWLDLELLCKTVPVVLSRRGAH